MTVNRGKIDYCWLKALATLLLTAMPLMAFADRQQVADTAFYARYSFIRLLDARDTLTITDEEFFDEAAKVVFPEDRYRLPKDNDLLNELEQTIIPRINADSLQLVRIILRGAASPDGPLKHNRQLGRKRVESLSDFVISRLELPVADSLVTANAVIEDYPSLCLMMRRANDPDYAIVQDLCDRYLKDDDLRSLKKELREAKDSVLWRRLYRTYYPSLRTARFIMVLRKYEPKAEGIAGLQPLAPVQVFEPKATLTPLPDTLPPMALVLPVITPKPEQPQIDTLLCRHELLSVKTNLLFYGAYIPGYDRWAPIPNIAVEYYPKSGHVTFGASFDMPWWQHYHAHKYFQFRNYQLEARYYLKAANMTHKSYKSYKTHKSYKSHKSYKTYKSYHSPLYQGLYLQAYTHAAIFGICFDKKRGWVGEGAGAGLGAGYVMPISSNGHWRLEFALQAGFFRCKYDPYRYENPVNPAYHDELYYYKWTGKPEFFKKRQYRWSWIGPTRIGITLTYDLLYRKPHPLPQEGGEYIH